MANEISKTITTRVSKGGAVVTFSQTDSMDMSGTVMATIPVATTTSWAALGIPASITGAIHIEVKNLDSANYIQLAVDSGGTYIFSRLNAGEIASFCRLPAVPYVRANTAAVNLLCTVYQQ